MDPLYQKLKQRRVVQISLAYLAAAWLLYQVLESLGGAWGIPPAVLRGTQVLLGLGFFLVLVLVWYHGELGRQTVTSAELTIIAALLLVGGLLISSVTNEAAPATQRSSQFRSLLEGGSSFALSPDGAIVATIVGGLDRLMAHRAGDRDPRSASVAGDFWGLGSLLLSQVASGSASWPTASFARCRLAVETRWFWETHPYRYWVPPGERMTESCIQV